MKRKPLSIEVVKELLERPPATNAKGVRDRAILYLMALQGLRVGEIADLDVDDLDVQAGVIHSQARKARGNGRTRYARKLALDGRTRKVLSAWLTVRTVLGPDTEAVFVSLHWTDAVSPPGQRISTRAIRQAVDGLLAESGVKRPGVSCDVLRLSIQEAARANPGQFL